MLFQRLLPDPGTVEIPALLEELALPKRACEDRPYLIANFVASVDGRASIGGRSGPLGDAADREMFHDLRAQVDAVMAGTTTLRIERYGRMVRDAQRRQYRAGRGLEPEPLACVVSRSGRVPVDIPLFAEPEARIVVFTSEDLDASQLAARVHVIKIDRDELTMTKVMRLLRDEFEVRSLLCEGGPAIFASLVRERLVDELFLTLAPRLAGGGTGATITSGPELPEAAELRLAWALEQSGSLYLRYCFD